MNGDQAEGGKTFLPVSSMMGAYKPLGRDPYEERKTTSADNLQGTVFSSISGRGINGDLPIV